MLPTTSSPRTMRHWFLITLLVCFVVAVALYWPSNLLGREKMSNRPVPALMDTTDTARSTEGSSGSRGRRIWVYEPGLCSNCNCLHVPFVTTPTYSV